LEDATMRDLDLLLHRLDAAPAVLVRLVRAEGSVPREVGAWMAVFEQGTVGSIGGGRLEHQAIADARGLLAPAAPSDGTARRYALGPSLGQCCGGVAHLRFDVLDAADRDEVRARLAVAARPVALFGAGHVGRAIVRLAAELPLALHWIDSRDGVFPPDPPTHVRCEQSDPVQRAVADLDSGSQVLVMSFSHAEDLEIVAACLQRQRERGDLRFIGLIGSRTKWASFRHRLRARGFAEGELATVHCPIGVPGITGKQPAVVALAALAQLLQQQK
jgi:xanthine dehydrogenase accessory factor